MSPILSSSVISRTNLSYHVSDSFYLSGLFDHASPNGDNTASNRQYAALYQSSASTREVTTMILILRALTCVSLYMFPESRLGLKMLYFYSSLELRSNSRTAYGANSLPHKNVAGQQHHDQNLPSLMALGLRLKASRIDTERCLLLGTFIRMIFVSLARYIYPLIQRP